MSESKGNATSPPIKPKTLPAAINFLNGGLSGMAATCVVHPMDVIKNRMQMSKEKIPISKTVSLILESGGITKFYAGLSAGLLRQATYTTARLGIYNQLSDMWRAKNEGAPSFLISVVMGMTAGASGAFIGTPTEVALVRMTSDGRLPLDQRRNYKNVFDAFMRIIKEEGLTTLWRGSVATMGRAAVVNASQLATYSQAKILLSSKAGIPDGIPLHFCASMISGFLTAFNSMPFDIAKTRIQNSSTKEKKIPGVLTVIMTIAKSEGAGALWKGFWPTYCRIGPHTHWFILYFVVMNEALQFAQHRN